jgi:plasmid maintenance system antidote protein VapI
MKPRPFSELYREAEQHQDYWVASTILESAESLVREMARQRLTRTTLAERLDATPTYVTKVLRGKDVTPATMLRLSRALGANLHVRLRRQVGKPSRAPAARSFRSTKPPAGQQRSVGKPRLEPATARKRTR